MIIDHLIIGQGLAGSLLAWELSQRGGNVIIVDSGQENASQVAAGLINPITGMRFVKSPDVDVLLPTAKQYYANLAAFFAEPFYIEKPMLRLFKSPTELNHCLKRFAQPDYQAYLGKVMPASHTLHPLITPYGFLQQQQTGYLLTRPLLSRLKGHFIANGCYRQAVVDYQDIQLLPTLRWQAVFPKQIIFCEGHQLTQNPWFSWLPLQRVKGEILTLQQHSALPDNILNYGDWLIPLNSQHIRVGASFDRQNLNALPTESAKNALLSTLKPIWAGVKNTTLINHQANIRPCTRDKQPFIGLHPQYPQLAIFNGFGAKGSLQIPWCCLAFADALLNNAAPPSDIRRHYATHYLA